MKYFKTAVVSLMILMSAMNVFSHDSWITFTDDDGPGDNEIISLAIDLDGAVWVGTKHDGVFRYYGNIWTKYTTDDVLADNNVRSIAVGSDGVVWFGTYGGGISCYDGKTWTSFIPENEFPLKRVKAVAVDQDCVVWIGTTTGVARYNSGEWTIVTVDNSDIIDDVLSIAIGHDGTVWFGRKSGLSCYDGETWKTFTMDDGMAGNYINTVAVGYDNVVWVGAYEYYTDSDFSTSSYLIGRGISRYDYKKWEIYTEDDGLSFNFVNDIEVDPLGAVWIGTTSGISRYDGETWMKYTTDNGLADNLVRSIAICSDGLVWVGTAKGLSCFDPTQTIVETHPGLPSQITILGNFPNPFNSETTIKFATLHEGIVNLSIYNISGQQIHTLISENITTGIHCAVWDGRDESGYPVSSGLYFSRLYMGTYSTNHQMMLLK